MPQYAHPIYSLCIQAPLVDFFDADLDDFWYIVHIASSSRVVHKGDTKDQVVTFTNMVVVVKSGRGNRNCERATEGCCEKGGIGLG
jgi:hypothetical protein